MLSTEIRRRQRKTASPLVETEEDRHKRLEEERERRAQQRAEQRAQSSALVVYTFKEWCALRGFSEATGRRLIASKQVKVTHLSERRIGIRTDHDQEYLDSCVGDSA